MYKKKTKPFQAEMEAGDDSYSIYARPYNGRTATRPHPHGGPGDTILLTSQWVVPHNPVLLLKYNCHINVNICYSIRSVKYMHKYVYKGHDRAEGRLVGAGGGPRVENDAVKCKYSARRGSYDAGLKVPIIGTS